MAKTPSNLMVAPGNSEESVSTTIRKIDNGYIVRRSRSTDTDYESSESYTRERPMIGPEPQIDQKPTQPTNMRKAIDVLNRK
jgi:hypothetical protein